MKPKSLSASALMTYEGCPRRYRAEQIERVPGMSGIAADQGTLCHAALEAYVVNGDYKNPSLEVLKKHYDAVYHSIMKDMERYQGAWDMLENWWNRTDLLDGRNILSCEIKETFDLPTSAGPIPVTYIWDRCDELPDGAIEVVDYKTVAIPIQPEELKHRIQPRIYALAAAIKYPNRPAYWVSYDLLRYDLVGVRFTREDNVQTWNWLKSTAERILADDGEEERLNPECRWCVRKTACETLTKHTDGGGILGISDIDAAIDKRARLDYAKGALTTAIAEIDAYILAEAEEQNILEHRTQTTEMKITARATREIDSERAAKVLGPEIMSQYGKLPISAIDSLLKTGGLDSATKSELKQLIRKKMSAASVKTKPISSVEEE